jgi:hypothetical protein
VPIVLTIIIAAKAGTYLPSNMEKSLFIWECLKIAVRIKIELKLERQRGKSALIPLSRKGGV